MFIEKRGDEMKLLKCTGQSVLYLVVEDGKAHPIPCAGGTWMHRILPEIPGGEDVRDGAYAVDDMKALRSLLFEAGEYGRLRVFPGTGDGVISLALKAEGGVIPGPRMKKVKWQDSRAEGEYAPHLHHFAHGMSFRGDDLARLKKLARVCGKAGHKYGKLRGVWVEKDGTAVGSDEYRMAWTELEFAPPCPLWIPAQLIKSARNSVFVEWTPGAQWAHGTADALLEYLWEDPTYKDGFINWRRPIPERPDFRPLAFDFRALRAVGKDGTARRRTEFRPEGLFPDGMSCKMDAEYLESVPLVLGRKGLKAYADTDYPGAWVRWESTDYYTRPVWFRSDDGSVDMLVMPMRPY